MKNKKSKKEQQPSVFAARIGRCEKCGHGSFLLKAKGGKLERYCSQCGHLKIL